MASYHGMSLDTLPYFILEDICDYVVLSRNQRETPRRSLWPFSSASRRCYSAAAPILFRQIRVVDSGIATFGGALEAWEKILATGNHMRHVRELILMYPDYRTDDDKDYMAFYGAHLHLRPASVTLRRHWPIREVTEASQDMWQTLSRLISGMHGLLGCRLHMHCFNLPSLYQFSNNPSDISPDDYALITSPSLYSIVLYTAKFDRFKRVDYQKEALLRMIAGTSPNLAHVRLRDGPLPWALELQNWIHRPRPPWPGFFPSRGQKHEELSIGGLKTLVFPEVMMSQQDLDSFSRATDFSKLACLSFKFERDDLQSYRNCYECISNMLERAERGQFPSLEALSLHYVVGPRKENDQEFIATLVKLLNALRPLRSLCLTPHYITRPEALAAAVSRHTLTPSSWMYAAVWAAQFWENYSNGLDDEQLGADIPNDPAFDDGVLKFMRGETVDAPAPG
ncbi:hypothetical protein GGR51DRAFT_566483 [Nemania sp. FL0031]|nr:hypothetical protein GGR51DRAFT_566483 [Nemania sp. FL0031]